MHPYLPFAALPTAVFAAWFAAAQWPASNPGRYQVPPVVQITAPSAPTLVSPGPAEKPDIRIKAFLPHVPPKPAAPEPDLILHSVMTGADVRLATINGSVVREGDRVEGYRVRRIAADGVVLVSGGKTRRLPMRPLHELPPPVQAGEAPVKKDAATQRGNADLTQDFWKIFDLLKP